MQASLTEILRKTMAAIENDEEFRHDAPAIIQLRRELACAIGDLEIARGALSSNPPNASPLADIPTLSDFPRLRPGAKLNKVKSV